MIRRSLAACVVLTVLLIGSTDVMAAQRGCGVSSGRRRGPIATVARVATAPVRAVASVVRSMAGA